MPLAASGIWRRPPGWLLATGFIASFCFLVSVAQRVPLLALAENFAADWIAYFAEPGQSEQHP